MEIIGGCAKRTNQNGTKGPKGATTLVTHKRSLLPSFQYFGHQLMTTCGTMINWRHSNNADVSEVTNIKAVQNNSFLAFFSNWNTKLVREAFCQSETSSSWILCKVWPSPPFGICRKSKAAGEQQQASAGTGGSRLIRKWTIWIHRFFEVL